MNNEEYLSIDEFADAVKDKLQAYYADECIVSVNSVTKNNDQRRHGITIKRKGYTSAPNIYLDDAYEEYIQGKSLERITSELICLRNKCKDEVEFDADLFTDYNWVRGRLGIRIINRMKNARLLTDVPHRDFADMALVFYVAIDDESIGKGTILIHNEHMTMWDISSDRLYDDALASSLRNNPPYMADMVEALIDILRGEEETEGLNLPVSDEELREKLYRSLPDRGLMYVLSNQSKLNGASVIAYPGMLNDIAQKLGCDYYLLPSSIHEVIILPMCDDDERGEELSMLVKDVNNSKLKPDEVLSDHAYRYHSLSNWLEPIYEYMITESAS